MASVKRIPPHLILVNSLNSWANLYSVKNDSYVSGLTDAVSERKNLPMWASLDPLEYLPHSQIDTHKKLHLTVLIMTVIRNALVFLPVALTWIAVGEATTAFSAYLKANGSDIVNFLDFWQNGYGVLDDKWKIANVAILDFWIIMVVIVLTLIASVFSRRVTELQMMAEKETDRERILLSVEIASYLFDKQKVTNVTMNQSLARALDKLLNATEAIEATAKALEKTSKSKGLN
jgi:hypothetical protein